MNAIPLTPVPGPDPTARTIAPRRPLADDVYEALLGMLMDQVIEPGSRASIDGLARNLDVSPTPVREALARLESEGLVAKQPLKGYTAAPLLEGEGLQHLFDLRLLLEPHAAHGAATRMGADDLARLDDFAAGMHLSASTASAGAFESYRSFAEQDAAFHDLVAQRSGNPLLADAIMRLHPHMHLYRLYFERGIAAETDAEHAAITAALRARDADAAELAMHTHLAASRSRMVARR